MLRASRASVGMVTGGLGTGISLRVWPLSTVPALLFLAAEPSRCRYHLAVINAPRSVANKRVSLYLRLKCEKLPLALRPTMRRGTKRECRPNGGTSTQFGALAKLDRIGTQMRAHVTETLQAEGRRGVLIRGLLGEECKCVRASRRCSMQMVPAKSCRGAAYDEVQMRARCGEIADADGVCKIVTEGCSPRSANACALPADH